MPDIDKLKADLRAWLTDNATAFDEAAGRIWENPELPMQEAVSSRILSDLLEENGFAVRRGVGGMPTAFVAEYGEGGPVIAINCEYDALPGLSQRPDLTEKSPLKEGAPGHGCGHNLLGTAAVKAAAALKRAMEKHGLAGRIKVLGAPAEELCLGKAYLGKAGELEGIDAVLDWHPWGYNRADADSCQAYVNAKFHFRGRTCHGNSPWHGRSALDAAMLMAQASEYLREHIYPGAPPDAANTFNYTFSETGPEMPSVVSDRASLWYVGRFITSQDAQEAFRRICECARGAAIATETETETEIIAMTNHKIANETLARVMHANFEALGAPVFTESEQAAAKRIQREMGAPEIGIPEEILPFGGGYSVLCDTSEYSWNAPYVTAWIAMAPGNVGWHHWGVNYCAGNSMGKKALAKAAELIAWTAAELLTSPELIDEAKREWREKLADKTYRCLLPEGLTPPIDLNKDVMDKYRSAPIRI
jgi:aminobenzoyl-glutamate utilization protein B